MNRLVRWSCADLIHGCTYRNSLINNREKKLPSVLSQGCRLFFCSAKHPQKESACAMEAITGSDMAPFLTKLFQIVSNEATEGSISWTAKGDSFVISDPDTF